MKLGKLGFLKNYGIVLVLLALVLFFSLTTSAFFSSNNLLNVARQVAMLGISAIGMTFVILTGGIDLSVGSLMSLLNIVGALLMVEAGVHPVLAVLLSLVLAAGIGSLSGVIITRLRIPPLITTLAMMTSLRGLSYVLSGGLPVWGFPEGFRVLGQGYVGIVPIPVIIMVVCFVLGWLFLNKTSLGLYIYGIGGNEEASRLSGINVRGVKVMVYGLCSLLTGIASMIMLSRLNTGQPVVGTMFELQVITAVVLGGVSIMGGEGKLFGVFIGVLIIGVLNNGMIILNVSEYYQRVASGIVLLVAVSLDNFSKGLITFGKTKFEKLSTSEKDEQLGPQQTP
jgi:ribose transport system permease protein